MEIFWNTIAQYNEATWWAQFLITAAGILLTTQLYRKPTLWAKRSMKIYMVFLNGWISIVYYMMYCGARGHHHILAIFWGVIAVLWLWDLFTGYTPFERNPKYKVLVGVLYAMPFLYPLLSWARGMEFPMMTTTVMPSFRLMSLIRVRMEWVVLGSSALVASSQSRTLGPGAVSERKVSTAAESAKQA